VLPWNKPPLLRLSLLILLPCVRGTRRGFGLDIGFIDHFNTWLVTTLNCSTIANFHTLHNSRAFSVFTSSCLITAPTMVCSLWMAAPFHLTGCQSQSYFTTGGLTPISSSWAPSLLRPTTKDFFQLNPYGHSPYITSCLTRGWVCLMNVLGLLSSVLIPHVVCYWNFFPLRYVQVLCQSSICKADHAYIT
jgi:hypothetical protein